MKYTGLVAALRRSFFGAAGRRCAFFACSRVCSGFCCLLLCTRRRDFSGGFFSVLYARARLLRRTASLWRLRVAAPGLGAEPPGRFPGQRPQSHDGHAQRGEPDSARVYAPAVKCRWKCLSDGAQTRQRVHRISSLGEGPTASHRRSEEARGVLARAARQKPPGRFPGQGRAERMPTPKAPAAGA